MSQAAPRKVAFSKRRQHVGFRRSVRRALRVIGEGLRMMCGGATWAPWLAAVFIVGLAIWQWHHGEGKKVLGSTPTEADWRSLSEAISRQDPALCDEISKTASLWTPAELPNPPAGTLRPECYRRVALARRNAGRTHHLSPVSMRQPFGQGIGPDAYRQGLTRPTLWPGIELPRQDVQGVSQQQRWQRERQQLDQAQRKSP